MSFMKIRVCVLFGGRSVEHEISVISGLQAYNSLDRQKYEVTAVYISKSGTMYCGERISDIGAYKDIDGLLRDSYPVAMARDGDGVKLLRLEPGLFKKPLIGYIDVVLPVVHGTNVEDGTAAGYLNMLGAAYAGCDILSSSVGMDKYATKLILRESGIPVLDCRVYTVREYDANPMSVTASVESELSYPVIVKPVNLGSSVGISVARDKEELVSALEEAFRYSRRVLVERAISSLTEINCSVLGDYDSCETSLLERPVSTEEILSYSDKYIAGSKGSKGMASTKRVIPADISLETTRAIEELAKKAFTALGCCGVARLDFMIDNSSGSIYLNEINTIPGSLSFYLWEPKGVSYSELLDRLISLALKRRRDDSSITYTFDTNVLSNVSLQGAKGAKLGGKYA